MVRPSLKRKVAIMIKFPASAQPVFSAVAASSTGQYPHPIGSRGEDIFGRVYRYAVAGAVDLVVGNVLQAPAQIANHLAMTPSVAAIGDKTIAVTPGATGGAAALYWGGIAVIDTTPGVGFSYPLKGHDTITSSVLFTLLLADGWPVQVALTAVSRVSLASNPYANVIQSPVTTLTGVPVGVCQFVIPTTQGGWVGVHGHFGTLIQGTPAVGQSVSAPASAAGAAAINSGTLAILGTMMQTGVDGKVNPVFWTL